MRILYKYLSPSRIGVLENNELRISQPCVLNDPFDSLMALRSRLEEQHGDSRVLEDDFYVERIFADMLRKDFGQQIGVLSLSSDPVNTLMWSHYSQSHTGLLIHINTGSSFFQKSLRWKSLSSGEIYEYGALPYPSPVKYLEKRPEIYMEDGVAWDILFHKSMDWSYEKEFRSLINLSDCRLVKSTANDEWPVYLGQFTDDTICGVTIGLQTSNETKSAIFKSANKRNIPVYQIKLDHIYFGLVQSEVKNT